MTTKVTADAHAGWPVEVTTINLRGGPFSTIVPANEVLDFYVHSTATLHVREGARDGVQPASNLTFGEALIALKMGKKVARSGWNGNGMFVYRVPAASYPVQTGAAKSHFGEGALVPYRAYYAIKTVDNDVATWAPSNSDMDTDDWLIVG